MLAKLEGYAAALLSGLDDAGRASTASDLTSVDRLVESEPALRAALTDTAIPSWSRSAVLRDLLSGRIGDTAVRLTAYAARSGAAQDVPATLANLAHYAVVRTRAESHVPSSLSLFNARRRVSGFADAVLEDLHVDEFGEIEDALFRWARTIEANRDLRRVLVDRDADVTGRIDMVRRLLEGKVAAPTLRLALYVVEGGRPRDVVGTLDYLVDYTARARDWRVARVWSARELDDSSRDSLTQSLVEIAGHPVDVQVALEEDLLSGVLVQIGDLRLDASTKGRLHALRDALDVSLSALSGHPTTN
jgi:F-type H+-transporting ATPase subunit delta